MTPMPIELVDTHCHLATRELLPQAERVIAEAVQAGVTRMIVVACVPAEIEPAIDLQSRHPAHLWLATGIHPHEAARVSDADLQRVADTWQQPEVVACGEMGLDYHYNFSPRDVQRDLFTRQLELARSVGKPIVIHSREATEDTIGILESCGYRDRPVVVHCFSGGAAEATEIRRRGWRTSFTGIITFKKAADVQQALVATPAEELMFETDAPYLAPEPVRKLRPNEPKTLAHTARFAAMLRDEPYEELAARTTANALAFFGLPRQ